ncbi:CubicO group peptidase, beta-lactamase class C family [Rhodospirillales bacterium URHD0017]|nr:CubicO group peptidase, beta-lactamase class C family [Rhodospirillales bacterium URHD0017]
MHSWEPAFLRLLNEAAVPGAAIALVEADKASFVNGGVRGGRTEAPVDELTIFDAASLSKPVFAHVVLQLVDRGDLALDARIEKYLPGYLQQDGRSASITVRHLLSHSGGLPNWRNADYPLRPWFEPGERFSYSGEGYLYLQRAVEAVTGVTLDDLATRLVFQPLGMERSSFVWQSRFNDNRAWPHDAFGMPALGNKPAEANAAWSLQTCAADFARFLRAVLAGGGLKTETSRLWLSPQVEVRHAGAQRLEPSAEDVVTGVAWGLGWGLEPSAGTFFQWGDNGPFTAFTLGSATLRKAIVVFTNANSGMSIMPELMASLFAGERPSLKLLGYVANDAPVRRLFRAALLDGVEATWPEMQQSGLTEAELRWIAHGLNAKGREKESGWLRARSGSQPKT